MKELRVKVWNAVTQQWLPIDSHKFGWYINSNGRVEVSHGWDSEDNPIDFWEESAYPYIIVQAIGLKDINGKDIYEGDIIDFHFETYGEIYREEIKRGVIEFKHHAFFFVVHSEEEEYPLHELSFDSESDIKVIGNIYENPELGRIPAPQPQNSPLEDSPTNFIQSRRCT